jgi:recombinational DNA repair protein (RecF pathway)
MNKDITIIGNNNKLYRGRIDSCQIIPLKKSKENKLKLKSNIDENNQIYLDQFNQTNKTIIDEHLFEYLDWQIEFNEQVFRRKINKKVQSIFSSLN